MGDFITLVVIYLVSLATIASAIVGAGFGGGGGEAVDRRDDARGRGIGLSDTPQVHRPTA